MRPYRPARLERARCFAARVLMHTAVFARLAVAVLPRSHPYRSFAGSTLDELRELADVTCKPRYAATILYDDPRKRSWLVLALIVLAFYVTGETLAAVPFDFGAWPDVHLGIREAMGLDPIQPHPQIGPVDLPWHSPWQQH